MGLRDRERPGSGVAATATGGRLLAGDPLRAIAALSVLAYHAAFMTAFFRGHYGVAPGERLAQPFGDALGPVAANLNLGLYIFFVLSGYLIARPFVRSLVEGAPRPAMGPYIRNRLLRIVPAFWLVLTVVLVVVGTLGASTGEIAATYAFLISTVTTPLFLVIGQSWTLGVELLFYLSIPVLAALAARLLGRRGSPAARAVALAAGAGAIACASLLLAAQRPEDQGWQQNPHTALWAFLPGVLLALAETGAEQRVRGRSWGRPLAAALAVGGVALLAVCASLPPERVVARGALIALGSGALVAGPLVLQWATGDCWRLLDNRVLHWVGERSYSLYLVHVAALYLLRDVATGTGGADRGFWLLLAAGLPAALVAAAVSHRLFEVPFLRRRARWAAGRRPAATGEP